MRKMKESFTRALDLVDTKILRALQAEGRLTNAELAARVNVSPATCHRRTQRLFDEGYITGVRAEIAPAAVNLGALVMVGVVLDRSTPESFAAFEGAVLGMKDVLDCNLVAGDFDYLLKIRVRDMADFNKLHGQKLRSSGCQADPHLLRHEGGERKFASAVLTGRPITPQATQQGTTSDCQGGSREPEQMRVVCGCPMHGEIGQDLANTRAEFEAMAGEPGGDDDIAVLR